VYSKTLSIIIIIIIIIIILLFIEQFWTQKNMDFNQNHIKMN